MNRQEVFNKVATHLLTQNEKARTQTGWGDFRCSYKADNGLKCAIGCLIPDDLYDKKIEGNSILYNPLLISILRNAIDLYIDDDINFLENLQTIHDQMSIKSWAEQLNQFAIDNKLIMISIPTSVASDE